MDTIDVKTYMQSIGREARAGSRLVAKAETAAKNRALTQMAAAIQRDEQMLLAANAMDVESARKRGLDPAVIDRLTLSSKSIAGMAEGLLQIAALADPVGEISDLKYRPSGIQVGRMRVPLGVVGIIYEARPNVTADAAGLCLKAGNAAILRGGSEAINSNRAIAACVKGVTPFELREKARRVKIDQPLLHFLDRQDVAIADDQIDVVERNAFGLETIIDHFLVEARCMLRPCDPLLGDGKRDGAVA